MARAPLGPAIPIGFGGVLEWLMENGYMVPPSGSKKPASRARGRRGRSATQRTLRLPTKPKRKVSAYQREFGRQLKKLKKAHPRTPVTRLMKRAHAATRRARRG